MTIATVRTSVKPASAGPRLLRLKRSAMALRATDILGCLLARLAVFAGFCLFVSSSSAATWTVTDNQDNLADANSLRYAVSHAKAGDTIAFATSMGGQAIILTSGTLSISTNLTIQGPGAGLLTISGNNATTVFTINSGSVTISGLTVAYGSASANQAGGGIQILGGTVTVTACTLSNNSAASGGGIANSGTLIVSNSTFSGNSAGTYGGSIENRGTLTVTNSTFSGNSATYGGAIDNESGAATLDNTTVSANSAESSGGGIFNNTGSSPAPTLTLRNTIVAGNTSNGTLGSNDCNGCGTQSQQNLIGGAPQLGALGWNGNLTQTMIPLPGSPVIGAGIYQAGELNKDQRGFKRPSSANAVIDLGAVQTRYLTVTTLTDASDTSCGDPCSLRDALNEVDTNHSADIIFQAGLVSATSPGTITIIGAFDITGNVNLIGPGGNELTVLGSFVLSLGRGCILFG